LGLMINPKQQLWLWGPLPGRPYLESIFLAFMRGMRKYAGTVWPETVLSFWQDKMLWINPEHDLFIVGQQVFRKCILSNAYRKALYRKFNNTRKALTQTESILVARDLNKLSEVEFVALFRRYTLQVEYFWQVAIIPELAGLGGEILVKNIAKKYFKPNEFTTNLEIISAPRTRSFYQKAERELYKIPLLPPKKRNLALKNFQKHYFWLSNNFLHIVELPVSHFKRRLKAIVPTSREARRKLKAEASTFLLRKQRFSKLVNGLTLNQSERLIIDGFAQCLSWQDLRKAYVMRMNHYRCKLLQELARRHKISFVKLQYMLYDEVVNYLVSGNIPQDIGKRLKDVTFLISEKKFKVVTGKLAQAVRNRYVNKSDPENSTIYGQVVSRGQGVVRGQVFLVDKLADIQHFPKKAILVTSMTSPDYIVAMRRAVAIVTDAGGLTSHAAILSRELGIPCVVGTKVATKVLKDGDRVEVDATKGIVRKL